MVGEVMVGEVMVGEAMVHAARRRGWGLPSRRSREQASDQSKGKLSWAAASWQDTPAGHGGKSLARECEGCSCVHHTGGGGQGRTKGEYMRANAEVSWHGRGSVEFPLPENGGVGGKAAAGQGRAGPPGQGSSCAAEAGHVGGGGRAVRHARSARPFNPCLSHCLDVRWCNLPSRCAQKSTRRVPRGVMISFPTAATATPAAPSLHAGGVPDERCPRTWAVHVP